MCLGIPMQISKINGLEALCCAKGIERNINLFLLQHKDVKVGDYVLVHVGYALEKITPGEAITRWQIFDEILAEETKDFENA